jgi:hypothetical protein
VRTRAYFYFSNGNRPARTGRPCSQGRKRRCFVAIGHSEKPFHKPLDFSCICLFSDR